MKTIERSPLVQFWYDEITTYESKFKDWEDRSKKIVKRYSDERNNNQKKDAQFNILWSNVQTLLPALYDRPPKPNIDRRFDEDKIGTQSAQVLERCADYFVDDDENFDDIMKQAVKDRLLCGRGTAWVRYVPHIKTQAISEGSTTPESGLTDDTVKGAEAEETEEVLEYEEVCTDYVHWKDFGHTWGRTWQEVRGVWRKVYMSRKELKKRFGDEIAKEIPLDAKEEGKEGDKDATGKKATIYEVWDKVTQKAYWVHKDYKEVLDKRDDPLGLRDFFPCPKPLYATLSNDTLIPTPDFVQYQDQAIELDTLTSRIKKITDALRVAGVYDSSAEGVERLLAENSQNKLIPVESFAILGEKGGLKGVIDWFPTQEIAATLMTLYEVRERVKQDLYEITGISDIIRGATDSRETATAQNIKGKFATLRLDDQQKDVARFARDLVRLKVEIIAEHFSLDTIKAISGVQLADNAKHKQIMMQQAQMLQQQQQQVPEEFEELLEKPSWEEVYELISNDVPRCYRIGIETDSTIKTDQEAEKQSRIEFLTAAGSFLQQASAIPNPDLHPLLMDMLMFGIKGFKVGRDIESNFDQALAKMRKKAKQAEMQPPQPSPEEIAAQKEAEMKQAEMQLKQGEIQVKQGELQGKAQSEAQKLQADMQAKAEDRALEMEKANAENAIKQQELELKNRELVLREREIEIKAQLEQQKLAADTITKMSAGSADKEAGEKSKAESDRSQKMMMELVKSTNEGIQQLAQMQADQSEALTKPKTVMRDANGQIVGVQ